MKLVNGFYLPEGEKHLVPYVLSSPRVHGGPTYQYHKLSRALDYVPANRRRYVVDVGAHCGLWSRVLAYEFDNLYAFEPIPAHVECFRLNVPTQQRASVRLEQVALGEAEGQVYLHQEPGNSGDTHVTRGKIPNATMRTLDSYELPGLDFLKIDCEGYERNVLLGGQDTVRRFRPTIIVEQKPGKGSQFGLDDKAAVSLLQEWGAGLITEMGGDFILTW